MRQRPRYQYNSIIILYIYKYIDSCCTVAADETVVEREMYKRRWTGKGCSGGEERSFLEPLSILRDRRRLGYMAPDTTLTYTHSGAGTLAQERVTIYLSIYIYIYRI